MFYVDCERDRATSRRILKICVDSHRISFRNIYRMGQLLFVVLAMTNRYVLKDETSMFVNAPGVCQRYPEDTWRDRHV